MALTRNFKQTVVERVERDPAPAGNPSMDNLAAIFHAIRERLNVNFEAHSVAA